jgi:eukaryotic-like serine/threonine-protein kinase
MAKVFTITEGLENMGALKTGGQGSVYKARRVGEIITAVKLLPTPIHSESPEDRHFADFQNEVHKLKRVNAKPNPNVVKILSSGITETGSLPFIEMEYVEGPDLEDLLRAPHDPIFSIKEAIKVADQLSNALSHCHQVNVKHGDVKTNNIRLNIHTGNYVLLDFGMSMMSDEQRRTSLRHAGAIEFMAPEQNDGQILFQTDVYSFGVVLFELIAGKVPFPLNDRGETARTQVMLAHMEQQPPDLLGLRRQSLPANWSEDQKAAEMQVPEWLVNTIYICLQKKPSSRFADGKALHDYIVLRNTKTVTGITESSEMLQLKQEKQMLLLEKQELEKQLAIAKQSQSAQPLTQTSYDPYYQAPKKNSNSLFYTLLILGVIAGGIYIWYNYGRKESEDPATSAATVNTNEIKGQYKVIAARAYFYDKPDPNTRRAAFMVPSDDIVYTTQEQNRFVYTEFANDKGQLSKGWLKKSDLITLEEWNKRQGGNTTRTLTKEDINVQLTRAREFMQHNETAAAMGIYNELAKLNVPEALFESGDAGLKKKNPGLECGQAYARVDAASDKGYAPAKRTLGFLYFFADNKEILQINGYDKCSYERNVYKGTRMIMEAALSGDSTAERLVEELNIARMPGGNNNDTTQ